MSLNSEIRSAFRALRRQAPTTVLAVLTLSLGIGAATAMFSAINGILLRPLPYPGAGSLVVLSARTEPGGADQMSWSNYEDLRDGSQSLLATAGWSRSGRFIFPGEEPELIYGVEASHEFFDVLRVQPAAGRLFSTEDDREGAPEVMVISWELWHSRFGGDPAAIGRSLKVSSSGTMAQIIGVMPRGFRFPWDDREVSFYSPLRPELTEVDRTERAQVWMDVIGRLAPGATVASANVELETISHRLEQEYLASNRDVIFRAYPLHGEIFGDVEASLWILFAAVGAVLLIGCANIANLLLALAAGRTRELAVRSALGASRAKIVRQLLFESVTLGLVAGGLGLAIGALGLQLLIAIAPSNIPRLDTVGLDWRVITFGVGLSIATGLLFGMAPALIAARSSTSDALRENTRGTTAGRGRGRIREALVIAEIALALLLLPAAGLLLRTYWNLTSISEGFEARNVTVVHLSLTARHETDPQLIEAFRQVQERFESIPGVASVGAAQMLPQSQQNWVQDVTVVGRPEPEPGMTPVSAFVVVTPGYFETLRIPVKRGRIFSGRDTDESPGVAIVNESFAKQHFPGEDAIGQRIDTSGTREIVGIVGDVLPEDLVSDPMPAVYVPHAQSVQRRSFFLVRTSASGPSASEIRAALRQFDPAQPVIEIRELESYRAETFAARRLALWLLNGLALLAFTLAAIGIYSVMSYMVSQRRSEIGVRMAFGAEPRDIFRMVLRKVGTLLGAGTLLGILGAFAGTRLISRFLYGLSPSDPLTFAAVLVLLGVVAFFAGWFPARRAARVDPLVAMRYE